MPVINLQNEELQRLMDAESDLLILDVRSPQEYAVLGHIPEARLMPLYLLPDQVSALNPEQKTVLICEHGVRSADASHYLSQSGFKHIYNLTHGMAEWNGSREFSS